MLPKNPLFIRSQGGSITCFKGDSGRIFRSCSRSRCVYSGDLHSAKAYLQDLEKKNNLLTGIKDNIPAQRETTLKWSSNGELSAVDMARILDRLADPALTECDLACNFDDDSYSNYEKPSFRRLPASSWLP